MPNHEIDVKAITDKMEQKSDGCALLFDEAFQNMNKDFPAQMKVIHDLESEAKSRSDNTLKFDFEKTSGIDPASKKLMDYESVDIIRQDGTKIFQERASRFPGNTKLHSVEKTCKPG